jgi:hypothetical protein
LNPWAKRRWAISTNLTNVDDLPSDKIMISYIKEAVGLNELKISVPKKKTATKGNDSQA